MSVAISKDDKIDEDGGGRARPRVTTAMTKMKTKMTTKTARTTITTITKTTTQKTKRIPLIESLVLIGCFCPKKCAFVPLKSMSCPRKK